MRVALQLDVVGQAILAAMCHLRGSREERPDAIQCGGKACERRPDVWNKSKKAPGEQSSLH
eukprot:9023920-Prorocentrum_lima.AAC.1